MKIKIFDPPTLAWPGSRAAGVVTLTPDWEIDIRLICIMKTLPAPVWPLVVSYVASVDNMGQ